MTIDQAFAESRVCAEHLLGRTFLIGDLQTSSMRQQGLGKPRKSQLIVEILPKPIQNG
jgi:hypothetical protein